MGKAVHSWGTRLMQTVADAKYRQEAMAGVVACAGSIGPQFIVSHLETMQPAVSCHPAPSVNQLHGFPFQTRTEE